MTPPRGRPRKADTDEQILTAATEMLLTQGYAGFNIDEVAAAAEVAKTTLYRRWPTKDHLAVAVIAAIQDEVPITGTGDIRQDLTRYLTAIVNGLNTLRLSGKRTQDDPSAGTVAELTAAISRHPDLMAMSRAQFAKRNGQAVTMIEQAMAAGTLRPDTDPAMLFDQLAGALYYRLLITGQPIDPPFVNRLVANALTGLLTS